MMKFAWWCVVVGGFQQQQVPTGSLRPRRASVAEPETASTLETVVALARTPSTTKEAFASAIKNLESAVDAVRALDIKSELVTTDAFAATMEVIAERAPNPAAGALVGHAMARLKKRPDAATACMSDKLLSPLAAALLKARKNNESLTAIQSLSTRQCARDSRVGIVAAARLDDASKVKKMVQAALQEMKHDGGSDLDEDTLKFAIKVMGKSGDYRTPFAIIDALPVERRSPQLYHAAIAACGKAKPPKGKTAMLLWRRMKKDGFGDQISRATYNALLHCAQGSKDDDDVNANATTAILAEMTARGISLNVVSYNIALNSLAVRGRFVEMLELLDRMESSSIAPTEVTFGTAINGAAQANNSAAAVELLRAHVKHCDAPPADAAFGAALTACLRDPDGGAAGAAAQNIIDILAFTKVSLARRERIEQLAREAVHRGFIDPERLKRDEEMLGMVLRNRQVEV
ncbi:hypothetical protein CTAYLR_005227 [Chrysophaeum taylorii]|uniref:Pentacotripeptide-repeat region of PRORP domain-containing protein n=1 Tax=Chrysophaeum taylorii TaxID=2483200 RepID=A0AAD7XMQ4_9STRA|nr:hypothetical protein CTAYLR_005227 [Chrysophaeum taylorii]